MADTSQANFDVVTGSNETPKLPKPVVPKFVLNRAPNPVKLPPPRMQTHLPMYQRVVTQPQYQFPVPQRSFITKNNGRRSVIIRAPPQSQRVPIQPMRPPVISRIIYAQSAQPRKVPTLPTKQPTQKIVLAKKPPSQVSVNKVASDQHADIEDDEKLIQVDTFIEYVPQKLRSGLRHPDSVVETASLGGVSAPEIQYNMAIPEEIIDQGLISGLQLEAALYACQAHEKSLPSGERQGYLIGDGAGVGKGRTIAAVIYENWLRDRRRAIWVSVSSDLYYDAKRDLRDIGADEIEVHQLSSLKYAKIGSPENGNIKKGVMFLTYSGLIGQAHKKEDDDPDRITSRLDQLVKWCGEDFDGLIVFDECHHAKNLMSSAGGKGGTKTGRCVLKLQQELPDARVIYSSATGATKPLDMAYMIRLGLWGYGQAFKDFGDFLKAVEDRGVGAMELVAMDMKLRGLYLARQLSFNGVDFSIQEVLLTNEFIQMYDESVKLWMELLRQFQYAIQQTCTDNNTQNRTWAIFWATHQRFFKYLCIGAKVQHCVGVARRALEDGKCVVIGLQSTGESQTKEVLKDLGEITDFVSTTKAVVQTLIEKHFPTGDSGAFDIFKDMNNSGNSTRSQKGRKRRSTANPKTPQPTKRRSQYSSTGSQSGQSSDSETEDNSDTSSEDSSSSEEDEETTSKSANDNGEDSLYSMMMGDLDDADVADLFEVDPFHHDFSTGVDPWAHLQTQQDEAFNAAERERIEEEKRKDRKLRRKQRKRERHEKRRRESAIAEARETEAQLLLQRKQSLNVVTAADFMKSTQVISEDLRNGDRRSLMTIKAELLAAVERLGKILPPNTLDQLIDELGGPQQVAEMTGRKGRVIILPNGQAEYQLRNADSNASIDKMNLEEKDKFMQGEKLVAVISDAASSGISLQSDKRVPNQRRRVHITLELPWAGDKAIQQFGRTHRSNQANAPEYIFLISELAGEKRFASVVAKRLESLGALTHGDRRATESRDFSQFNIDNSYGREALKKLIEVLANKKKVPIIPPHLNYALGPEQFFDDMRQYLVGVGILSFNEKSSIQFNVEKEATSLPKFLNRLLGLPFNAQNSLFSYFTNIIGELIKRAKVNGTFDNGILDLGSGTDLAKKIEHREFRGFIGNPNFVVVMHKIGVDRDLSWANAKNQFDAQTDPNAGFYLSNPIPNRQQTIILVINNGKSSIRNLCVLRPNTRHSNKGHSSIEINRNFTKVSLEEAEVHWNKEHEALKDMCLHSYTNGRCDRETGSKVRCEYGRRSRTYFVLTGSVIAVWPELEKALNESHSKQRSSYMQIVRISTDDDQKLVGLLVAPDHVRSIIAILTKMCDGNQK